MRWGRAKSGRCCASGTNSHFCRGTFHRIKSWRKYTEHNRYRPTHPQISTLPPTCYEYFTGQTHDSRHTTRTEHMHMHMHNIHAHVHVHDIMRRHRQSGPTAASVPLLSIGGRCRGVGCGQKKVVRCNCCDTFGKRATLDLDRETRHLRGIRSHDGSGTAHPADNGVLVDSGGPRDQLPQISG